MSVLGCQISTVRLYSRLNTALHVFHRRTGNRRVFVSSKAHKWQSPTPTSLSWLTSLAFGNRVKPNLCDPSVFGVSLPLLFVRRPEEAPPIVLVEHRLAWTIRRPSKRRWTACTRWCAVAGQTPSPRLPGCSWRQRRRTPTSDFCVLPSRPPSQYRSRPDQKTRCVIRALNPIGVELGLSEVAFGGELCRCSPTNCTRCCTVNCALHPRLGTCRRQCPLSSRAWTLILIVTSAPAARSLQ